MRAFERLCLGLAARAEPEDLDGVDRRLDIPRVAELRSSAEDALFHAARLLPNDPDGAASALDLALRHCVNAWLLQGQIVLDSEDDALLALARHAPLLALRVQWALGRQDPRDRLRLSAGVFRAVFGREPLDVESASQRLAHRPAHAASSRIEHDGNGSPNQPVPFELLR